MFVWQRTSKLHGKNPSRHSLHQIWTQTRLMWSGPSQGLGGRKPVITRRLISWILLLSRWLQHLLPWHPFRQLHLHRQHSISLHLQLSVSLHLLHQASWWENNKPLHHPPTGNHRHHFWPLRRLPTGNQRHHFKPLRHHPTGNHRHHWPLRHPPTGNHRTSLVLYFTACHSAYIHSILLWNHQSYPSLRCHHATVEDASHFNAALTLHNLCFSIKSYSDKNCHVIKYLCSFFIWFLSVGTIRIKMYM